MSINTANAMIARSVTQHTKKPPPPKKKKPLFAGKCPLPSSPDNIKLAIRPPGQLPKYRTEEALRLKCDEYFVWCDAKQETYSVPELSMFLGFISRQALFAMLKRRKYVNTITQALSRIEIQRSKMLINPDNRNSRGSIFDLQNNFGWRDRQDINVSGTVDTRMAVIPVFPSLDDWQKAWDRQVKQASKIPELPANGEIK